MYMNPVCEFSILKSNFHLQSFENKQIIQTFANLLGVSSSFIFILLFQMINHLGLLCSRCERFDICVLRTARHMLCYKTKLILSILLALKIYKRC